MANSCNENDAMTVRQTSVRRTAVGRKGQRARCWGMGVLVGFAP